VETGEQHAVSCVGRAGRAGDLIVGELEEVALDEASALRARESLKATALEVDALVRQDDEAVAVVEYRQPGS
jgi:hypothetical protein